MSHASAQPGSPAPVASYRPLSLLALAGLAVGVLCGAVVLFGGLFALLSGSPWLLPGWSALFPLAGAGLSLAGLLRVRRSEGTVGGGRLARWGVVVSVLAGAGYWAYYGTLLFALGREGQQVGLAFLTHLKDGDVPAAFRLTIRPVERPPEGPDLPDVLEERFNGVTRRNPQGDLTAFAETECVGALGRFGPATKIDPLGVEDWAYAEGGYHLKLLYRAESPAMVAELVVTVEGKVDEKSGARRWRVVREKTSLKDAAALEANAEWKRTAAAARSSRDFAEKQFVRLLQEGKREEAFLCTRPAAERARLREAAGAALPGFDDFLAGGLVHAEPGRYRAPKEIRAETIALVRKAFGPEGESLAAGLAPDYRVVAPPLRREGDLYVVEHDFAFRVPPKPAHFLIEGRIVVEGDAAEADRGSMLVWRVREVDLVSGKIFSN
jgi:hypothetical protein